MCASEGACPPHTLTAPPLIALLPTLAVSVESTGAQSSRNLVSFAFRELFRKCERVLVALDEMERGTAAAAAAPAATAGETEGLGEVGMDEEEEEEESEASEE